MPGVDSSVLLSQLPTELDHYQPDIVAAMMGANDTYRGAIPYDDIPMVERGLLQHLKTWKLARQLIHQSGLPTHDDELQRARYRFNPVDGPYAGPVSEGTEQDREVVERARQLDGRGKPLRAEAVLRDAIEGRPESALLHEELGVVLRGQGRFSDAERVLRHAIELDPHAASIHVELAGTFQALFAQPSRPGEQPTDWNRLMEEELRVALSLDPENRASLMQLARVLDMGDRKGEAIALLERALALQSQSDDHVSDELANLYRQQGRLEEALALYRAALAAERADPCSPSLMHMVAITEQLGRPNEARELVKQVEERCLETSKPLYALKEFYREHGERKRLAEMEAREQRLNAAMYCPLTRCSYDELAKQLRSRGIWLVAVQYPRRPLEQLERHVEARVGARLVDNQQSFEDAVATHGYDAVFEDRCYGNLGHATALGNRILAENVSQVILELVEHPTAEFASDSPR